METQVSPAVVVIVLVLIVAILFGLYFLVVEARPPVTEDEGEAMPPADEAVGDEAMEPAEGEAAEGEATTEDESGEPEETGGEAETSSDQAQ